MFSRSAWSHAHESGHRHMGGGAPGQGTYNPTLLRAGIFVLAGLSSQCYNTSFLCVHMVDMKPLPLLSCYLLIRYTVPSLPPPRCACKCASITKPSTVAFWSTTVYMFCKFFNHNIPCSVVSSACEVVYCESVHRCPRIGHSVYPNQMCFMGVLYMVYA
jgi:hypothetical protein